MKTLFTFGLAFLISVSAIAATNSQVLVTCKIKDTSEGVVISLDEKGTYTISSGLYPAFEFTPTGDFQLFSTNKEKRVDIQVTQNSGQYEMGVTLQLNEDSSAKGTGSLWSKDFSMMRPRTAYFDLMDCSGTFKTEN